MNRRFFVNDAQPQGFPFIFGHPYFQTANLDEYDQVYEIKDPDLDQSKEKLPNEFNNDEPEADEKDNNETAARSLSSDRLRIDPNYKWLLKDLDLSNETRVIDVTDILEEKKENLEENEDNKDDKEPEDVAQEDLVENIHQEDDPVKLFYPNNDQLITQTSLNNTSRDMDDVTINTNNSYLKPEEGSDGYDDDHKNDESSIKRLYEKLIKPSCDSDKQNETIGNQESDYENPSQISLNEFEAKSESESENDEPVKHRSKFGKSFEASLSSMDNLIDRLDNGMKLKRNKDKPKSASGRKSMESEGSNKILESLKQEWSNMFSKLEYDYKNKLDEQQKLNDMKLKSLHDEIKKCIVEQEKFISKIPSTNFDKEVKESGNNLKTTLTISENSKALNMVDASTTTADSINPNTISDNTKYISNLRTELKSKHARHIQDLKDYYDKEIEDLRCRLDLYEEKYGTDPNDETEQLRENELKSKYEQLCEINDDLKESNSALIHKLEECNEHINYLKQENYELTSNLGQMNSKLKYAEERIQALQDGYAGLESQLSESIKLQDKYVRELQTEKRNMMKKVQENEDFQMNIKYYEQKCESYELKLDERDTIITRLKAKLAQTETDFNRLEYEYQKLKNSTKSSNLSVSNQQPYIASNTSKEANVPLQLPIKNQNRFSVPSAGESLNQISQALLSPRKQSPARNSNNQQLTILCNVNPPHNNQYSSSSSSSKSPGPARSRSPSVNKYDYHQANKLSNEASKANQVTHEGLIRFQSESFNHLNQHQKTESEDLAAAHSSCPTFNRLNNKFNPNISPLQQQAQSQGLNGHNFKISELSPEKQIKYIDKLEKEFDFLMKQRQQLDAKLTRLPYKATNPSMHAIRENVEEELNVVEKKIASVKLELRKLNIIKTH
ncbi:hypothetical protein BpHYR1_020601 [Brachionus plicatilis]|uniref:Uncharacterized protein n=1 Tax=Brachionus plicatilis TaxID=10195 RepID=A0A3M7PRP5_BRAPC|nr:hypothetical protein BpHYR1_020601 [Brachionus plicatilis]